MLRVIRTVQEASESWDLKDYMYIICIQCTNVHAVEHVPRREEMAVHFTTLTCNLGGIFNMYVGYNYSAVVEHLALDTA